MKPYCIMNRSWPSHAFESGLTVPAEWLDDVLLNPPLLPWSEFWPHFSTPLKPQRRLGGLPGLPKNAVLPTIIIKEEDRKLLAGWQTKRRIPIHIWHVFYDAAYGLSFDKSEELVQQRLTAPTEQVFQAPGGATTRKVIYKHYYHYGYPLGESVEESRLLPAVIEDKNGHILPYVTFHGGRLALRAEALAELRKAQFELRDRQ